MLALAAEEATFESFCECLSRQWWSRQFDGEAAQHFPFLHFQSPHSGLYSLLVPRTCYLNYHPDPVWNDGALGFMKRSTQQEEEEEQQQQQKQQQQQQQQDE